MNIDKQLLDNLTAQAQASPRLRMHYDLRDSADDTSQRSLNALEPGTYVPIHRHMETSETVVMLRGRGIQHMYDDAGNETGQVLLAAGAGDTHVASLLGFPEGAVPGMQVEKGQWHRLESLESGTVIVEMKDGAYVPIGEGDVLSM